MKVRSVSLAFCMFVLGVAGASGKEVYRSTGKTPNVPMLQVSGTNSFDLGAISDCIVTSVPFRVVNIGKMPVKINRLIPLCSCISATLSSTNDIPPGGEIVVRVAMDPRMVAGTFDRGLWVCANDTDVPYLKLALTGKVVPVFSGVPISFVALKLVETGRSCTNQFRLTANVPGVFLGSPAVVTNSDGLTVALSVVTNQGAKAQYDLTVVTTASVPGHHRLAVQLPIRGTEGASPLLIRFRGSARSNLVAAPEQIVLTLASQPQTYRVVLRGDKNAKFLPANLTWEPKAQGVRISSVAGRSENELLVRIEVTPDAAEALYLAKGGASVLFVYPGYGSARVPFVTEPDPPREKGKGLHIRTRPDGKNPFRF